jgi:hypothetical protein
MGEEEIQVRHGEDGILARNLATASKKIISASDVVDLLDCLPLVDDGDIDSYYSIFIFPNLQISIEYECFRVK